MTFRVLTGMLAVLVSLGLSARADTVFVKGREKPLEKVTIKSEDAKNVVVTIIAGKKKGDEIIPSVDIADIVYYDDIRPLDLRNGVYKAAMDAEKDLDSEDSVKRKKALGVVIAAYTQTLKEMKRDTKPQTNSARHLEYKLAVLLLKGGNDEVTLDRVMTRLKAFAKDHRDSWQINHVFPMMAQIQMESKDWKEASKTFEDMSKMEVFSMEVRREAKLMLVTVAVRAKDMDLANKQLDALDKESKDNPVFTSRVQMARAEVLVGLKQMKEAIALLQKIVKSNSDRQTMALAHNTLGECLYKEEKYGEARWEFLYVDTIYNQDKGQHAKALYYLWKTFEHLPADGERAKECRDMLDGPQFAGTEYQKLAKSQTK